MLRLVSFVLFTIAFAGVSSAFDVLTWFDDAVVAPAWGFLGFPSFWNGTGSAIDRLAAVLVSGLASIWAFRKIIKTINRS